MPAILTLNYNYIPKDKPWFTKNFNDFSALFKWLREDSLIILPASQLLDKPLHNRLILTKLALPKVNILVLSETDYATTYPLFTCIGEDELDKEIELAIINQHKIIDNRSNLETVFKTLS